MSTQSATVVVENDEAPVFRRLQIAGWRQLGEIEIDFHPRLTVLTGANASGKSTLLGILARHFEWIRDYSSSPSTKDGNIWSTFSVDNGIDAAQETERHRIGSLTYGSGIQTDITLPLKNTEARSSYALEMPQQQVAKGVFLNSHRQAAGGYSRVESIPTAFSDPELLLSQYEEVIRNRLFGVFTPKTPQLVFKEALMAAAVFGGKGNSALIPDHEATAIWEGYQELLEQVLPASLGFSRLVVRNPDVVIEARSGSFILDDASGGLVAMMEMTWQIFLRSRRHASFCVLLDEPENHLHPSLQRELIPSLLRAFPSVQFVVATHSPFVVTAAAESNVYVLDYNDDGRVDSNKLNTGSKASGAEETLQRVLGVPSTMPIWAETAFEKIVKSHMKSGISSAGLRVLRDELEQQGLISNFSTAISLIVDHDGSSEGN
ncbi:AAA family ATPase [Arthrobacter sp. Sr24]